MVHLYDHVASGNSYKIRLLLSQLGIEFTTETMPVVGDRDALRGPEFFARNPAGKIPTIVLDDGTVLAESTAILWYFAEGTQYLPDDKLDRVRVLQWMAFEQNQHETSIATRRYALSIADAPADPALLAFWEKLGHRTLQVMERHLAERGYFVAERYTIADIALYAYTHMADAGGFDLADYPRVQAWCERVRNQPGHVEIGQSGSAG